MGSKTILSILLGISILFSSSVTAISESSIPTEEKTETVERTVPNQNSAVNEVASVGDFLYGKGIVNKLICDIDGEKVIGSSVMIVNGDGTGDGVVNGKDLIRLKKQMLYGDVVKHTEFVDYNGDGIVDENDAEYLTSMM